MSKTVGQINLERWIKPEYLEQLYARREDPWINVLLNTLEKQATPERVIAVMADAFNKMAESRLEILTILMKLTKTQPIPPITLPVDTIPAPERVLWASRNFVNEVGTTTKIHVALSDIPGNFCRLTMTSPHITIENYLTHMELEQLRDAINAVLPKAP